MQPNTPKKYISMSIDVQERDTNGELVGLSGAMVYLETEARPTSFTTSTTSDSDGYATIDNIQFLDCDPKWAKATISKTNYETVVLNSLVVISKGRYTPNLTYYYTVLNDGYVTLTKLQ